MKNLTNEPLEYNGSILYSNAELSNSGCGTDCIIGEFSRVRDSVLGNGVIIDRNNLLLEVNIGDYSYTGPFDMIFACNIGKFSSISYGVTIGPPHHDYNYLSTHPFIRSTKYKIFSKDDIIADESKSSTLELGNDVWIGCNSTILRGIKIGDGAIIGANSLINKNVPPYAIVAGNPGRIIKYRFNQNIIDKLLRLEWWKWDITKIKKNKALFTTKITEGSLENLLNNSK